MKVRQLHSWTVSTEEAVNLQRDLAGQVVKDRKFKTPRYIAGVDISSHKTTGEAIGAVVVISYPELEIVEVQIAEGKLPFPYIPGLLSFREAPLTIEACEKLTITPDLFLIDGQGIAHPRRFGLASHLGLILDKPTIGCAKSLLFGTHDEVATERGSYAELRDETEVIGAALRTRAGTKPIYASIGNKIDLPGAIEWTLKCCHYYRIPEPTRLAHLAAGGKLDRKNTVRVVRQPKIIKASKTRGA